jgi:hypothetical protein
MPFTTKNKKLAIWLAKRKAMSTYKHEKWSEASPELRKLAKKVFTVEAPSVGKQIEKPAKTDNEKFDRRVKEEQKRLAERRRREEQFLTDLGQQVYQDSRSLDYLRLIFQCYRCKKNPEFVEMRFNNEIESYTFIIRCHNEEWRYQEDEYATKNPSIHRSDKS